MKDEDAGSRMEKWRIEDGRTKVPRRLRKKENFTAETQEFTEIGVFLDQQLFTRRPTCLRGE
jgi:hypothetical protein